MRNLKPRVSVVIPLFNRETMIKETLDSLREQTFQNWECLIVDDHSQDNGVSVVKQYCELDRRFRCLLRPKKIIKGANSCRNYGLERTRGELIYWLDSDDLMHPLLFEYTLKFFEDPTLDYVRFRRKLFSGLFDKGIITTEPMKPGKNLLSSPLLIEAMLLNEIEYNTCNVVWRKSSLGSEKFCEDIVYADEWEYYTRLLAMGLKGKNLENFLIYGRKHSASTTAEFKMKNSVRIESKIKATKLVLKTLDYFSLHTPRLKKYFLRLSFTLNSSEILERCLETFPSSRTEKWKFTLGFKVYPCIRPFFVLKGKISKV